MALNELSTFGLLKPYPIKRIVAMLHRVLETGLARQRDPDGVKFRPVVDLTASGVVRHVRTSAAASRSRRFGSQQNRAGD